MSVKDTFHRAITRLDARHVAEALSAVVAYDIPHWLLKDRSKTTPPQNSTAESLVNHKLIARMCNVSKRLIDAEPDPTSRVGMLLTLMLHCMHAYIDPSTYDKNDGQHVYQQISGDSIVATALKNDINHICDFAAVIYDRCAARLVPLDRSDLGTQVVNEYRRLRQIHKSAVDDTVSLTQEDTASSGPDASFFGIF